MARSHWFEDRVGVLATMHQKERVMAPLLTEELGLNIVIPSNFNTDCFGTFTREIQRQGTQLAAARAKAHQALKLTGETIAIASEGAFSPHPVIPYLACDRELVILIDRMHGLEIIGDVLSTETNYAHRSVRSVEEALTFAEQIGFPEHAVVVMFSQDSQQPSEIFKGITQTETLIETVEFVLQHSPTAVAHLETDMRAMHNPTRLQVIAQATRALIQKIKQQCPNCDCPGFDVVESQRGLPCELCQFPTPLIRAEIYQCQRCGFRQEQLFPQGVEFADPGQCPYCNP